MAKKIEDAIREAEGTCNDCWRGYLVNITDQDAYADLFVAQSRLFTLRATQARGETTVPEDGE